MESVLGFITASSLLQICYCQYYSQEITTPFLIRSQYDFNCYLAIGNSNSRDGHSLSPGEINAFFDCTDGGHWWTYQFGATNDGSCNNCVGQFFYSYSYGGYAQLQWDHDEDDGFRIGADEYNIKVDTISNNSVSDSFYITDSLDAIWIYNSINYSPARYCAMRHKTGSYDTYNKWISSSSTTPVSGYEGDFDCNTGISPINIDILFSYPEPTADPTVDPTKNPINPTNSPSKYPTKSPSANPTEAPSKHPSVTPSYNPTGSPLKQPTHSPSSISIYNATNITFEYGINMVILIPFKVNHNDTETIIDILNNWTDDIVNSSVHHHCVQSGYTFTTTFIHNNTILNVTISVCSKVAQQNLITAVNDEENRGDVITELTESVLSLSYDDISVTTESINKDSQEVKTTSTTLLTQISQKTPSDQNKGYLNDTNPAILTSIGCIVISCCCIVCFILVCKLCKKRELQLSKKMDHGIQIGDASPSAKSADKAGGFEDIFMPASIVMENEEDKTLKGLDIGRSDDDAEYKDDAMNEETNMCQEVHVNGDNEEAKVMDEEEVNRKHTQLVSDSKKVNANLDDIYKQESREAEDMYGNLNENKVQTKTGGGDSVEINLAKHESRAEGNLIGVEIMPKITESFKD